MWQAIERTRTILQIVVALATLAGLVSIWLRFTVPGWLTLLLVALGTATGALLGARATVASASKTTEARPRTIGVVAFKYFDDLLKHGWRVTHDAGLEPDSNCFEVMNDPDVGRFALIDAPAGTRVEYCLAATDFIADAFELEYRPENGSGFYVGLKVINAASSEEDSHHWIQYRIGRKEPSRFNHREWIVSVQPQLAPGKWLKLRRDLKRDFNATFGQDGLEFDHISVIRIRGRMSIASVKLLAPKD